MPEKQFLDYDGLRHFKEKLSKSQTPSSESSMQVGDITFSATKEILEGIPNKYLYTNGQVLSSSAYPELAEALGTLPAGYSSTKKDITNLLYVERMLQTPTGRVIALNTYSSDYGIYVSDDECQSFRKTLAMTDYPRGGIFFRNGEIICLADTYTYISHDDGETFVQYAASQGPARSTAMLPSGRFLNTYNSKWYYSDDGIAWTEFSTSLTLSLSGCMVISDGSILGYTASSSGSTSTYTFYRYDPELSTRSMVFSFSGDSSSTGMYGMVELDNGIVVVCGKSTTRYSLDYGKTFASFGANVTQTNSGPCIKTGPSSIYCIGKLGLEHGRRWIGSAINDTYTRSGIMLKSGTLVIAASYTSSSNKKSVFYYSPPATGSIYVPNVSGGIIRCR